MLCPRTFSDFPFFLMAFILSESPALWGLLHSLMERPFLCYFLIVKCAFLFIYCPRIYGCSLRVRSSASLFKFFFFFFEITK